MKGLVQLAVQRPITTLMAFSVILMLGLTSFNRLAIDLIPKISSQTINISTAYKGAGPNEIETLITSAIEKAASTVPNIKEIRSSSSKEQSNVTVDFLPNTDMSEAMDALRQRIDRIKANLPTDADSPVIVKRDPDEQAIIQLSLSGKIDPVSLRELADNFVRYEIEQVEGVATIDIWGGRKREVHVDVDRNRLQAVQLSADRLLNIIKAENSTLPAGSVESGGTEFSVRPVGEFGSIDDIGNVILTTKGGGRLYLKDVANVSDSFVDERRSGITRLSQGDVKEGESSLVIPVYKQSGSNTVTVADNVRAKVAALQDRLPQGIRLSLVTDNSQFIRSSINQVKEAGWQAGLLTLLVLIMFLQNFRTTIFISLSIPLSIVATFLLMDFAGSTLNVMTLGGLAIAIGMIVDDSIVVLENIFRHRSEGKDPVTAATIGASEVGVAVVASTLTTVCVFVPVIFLRGQEAIMFQQMALTVSFSLLASLAVSLTLLPMLTSRFLKITTSHEKGWPRIFNWPKRLCEGAINALGACYLGLLNWALSHRALVIIGSLTALLIIIPLVKQISVELMPAMDEGALFGQIQMPVGTTIDQTNAVTMMAEKIVLQNVPELTRMFVRVSGGGFFGGGSNRAFMFIRLVPKDQRTRSTTQVLEDLTPRLAQIPNARFFIAEARSLLSQLLGATSSNIVVDVQGPDLNKDFEGANLVSKVLEGIEGTRRVRVTPDVGQPEFVVEIDRAKAASMGISVANVLQVMQTNITGTVATKYRDAGNEYDILVRLREEDRSSLGDVGQITLTTASGQQVPLRNLIKSEVGKGPTQILRRNAQRIVTVTAGIVGRDLGVVNREMREKLSQIEFPDNTSLVFRGEFEKLNDSNQNMWFAFLLAAALVYMIMASLYESFFDPFVNMFTIPFVLIGVVSIL
ncbi:MAG: efflux RND transporter permease subunit, partial [Candidatus Tectomicrobia bacterium]|nr:efflux RND transporter permease subunit [Candidatus Tectomicrobia bacterium]